MYKVGDKVKIREDLEIDRRYNKCLFIEDMEKYKGKIATITRVTTTQHDNFGKISDYDIDIDDGDWCWTDDMFEDECKYPSKFKIGDEVRVRKDLEVNKDYNGLTLSDAMYRCHDIMTIKSADDDNYLCEENGYWWGEDMLEKIGETEENVGMTVEYLLNKTDVEKGGLIITIYYPNANFDATIGHNKINRNSELYKRFIKAYGDMLVDEVSFDIRNDNMVVMLIKVDYAD